MLIVMVVLFLASGFLRPSGAKVALPEGLRLADDGRTLLDAKGNPVPKWQGGRVANAKGHPLPPGRLGMENIQGLHRRVVNVLAGGDQGGKS